MAKGAPGDEFYQIANLWFDSRADLDAALGPPERTAAADAVKRFPELRGRIERQIFLVRSYWP